MEIPEGATHYDHGLFFKEYPAGERFSKVYIDRTGDWIDYPSGLPKAAWPLDDELTRAALVVDKWEPSAQYMGLDNEDRPSWVRVSAGVGVVHPTITRADWERRRKEMELPVDPAEADTDRVAKLKKLIEEGFLHPSVAKYLKPEFIDELAEIAKGHGCGSAQTSSGEPVDLYTEVTKGLDTGRKDDTDKPLFRLIPPHIQYEVAEVLTFGANKYGPENWRKVEPLEERYMDAALRHINAWQRGERNDSDTGLLHLSHAICCLMFIGEDFLTGQQEDREHRVMRDMLIGKQIRETDND